MLDETLLARIEQVLADDQARLAELQRQMDLTRQELTKAQAAGFSALAEMLQEHLAHLEHLSQREQVTITKHIAKLEVLRAEGLIRNPA